MSETFQVDTLSAQNCYGIMLYSGKRFWIEHWYETINTCS